MVRETEKENSKQQQPGMRLGKYELGKTLGQGNFGKVKLAKNLISGEYFALKILDKTKISSLNISDQIKREIATLKLLKHPNIVRLYEVLATKNNIYMVLEYVNGGELFEKISGKGKFREKHGRRLFQQLIDSVSYCHEKGVYHRDLKLENLLVDGKGNIKVTDFGLSALPRHFRDDGLLHTTCGSPNYVAPEILANRGYNGATADIWSCGIILFVILTGFLPFDDRNLAVLYQKILKGDVEIPKDISPGAQNMLKRILEPKPEKRITMEEIKAHGWFTEGYIPCNPDQDEDDKLHIHEHAFSTDKLETEGGRSGGFPTLLNAFQLIGMSSFLDLSGFFEQEDVSERKIRFTSNLSHTELLDRIQHTATGMGFCVHSKNGRLKIVQDGGRQSGTSSLTVAAEVFEISPSLYVVELRKSFGDASVYRQLCRKLSDDLSKSQKEQLFNQDILGAQVQAQAEASIA